jgi:NAD(P)H dehydrogenase (quinone)
MNIYILLAHPDKESFNGQLADFYAEAARSKNHNVRIQRLGEMKFDPILWKGYKVVQELEPDLKAAQENILWCEKWVIIYPIWWGSVPAIFKGFIDRTLYSGFAYKYHTKDPLWDKLLKGKQAHIITTCDAPRWWIWWMYRNSDIYAIKNATLRFSGISPVMVTRIGRMKHLSEEQRSRKILSIVGSIQ